MTRFSYKRRNFSAISYNTEHCFPFKLLGQTLVIHRFKANNLHCLSPQFISIQSLTSPCQCCSEQHFSQPGPASPLSELIFLDFSVFSVTSSRLGQTPDPGQRKENVLGTLGCPRTSSLERHCSHRSDASSVLELPPSFQQLEEDHRSSTPATLLQGCLQQLLRTPQSSS